MDGRLDEEQGSVSAEAALALPSMLLVFGLLLGAISVVAAQLNCVDAARVAARSAARGESDATAIAAASALAPQDATVRITRDGNYVHVVVTAEIRPGSPGGHMLPAVPVRAEATVAAESS